MMQLEGQSLKETKNKTFESPTTVTGNGNGVGDRKSFHTMRDFEKQEIMKYPHLLSSSFLKRGMTTHIHTLTHSLLE